MESSVATPLLVRNILIFGLFFMAPILFSHLPKLFGFSSGIADFQGFETMKRVWIFGGIIFLLVLRYLRGYQKGILLSLWNADRSIIMSIILCGLLALFQQYYYQPNITGILSGFGPIFTVCILLMIMEISTFSKIEFRYARRGFLVSLVPISLYAAVQLLWLDPISYLLPFSDARVFSTLGNPNSLAGIGLIALFFLHQEKNSRWIFVGTIMAVFLILASASLSGIILAIVYLLASYRQQFVRSYVPYLCASIGVIVMMVFFPEYAREKYLSIATRSALVINSLSILWNHPAIVLFWVDSETLLTLYQTESIPLARSYLVDGYSIVSSHFFPIDYFMMNGILPIGILCFLSTKKWIQRIVSLDSFWILLIFFGLHTPSIVHVFLLVLLSNYRISTHR